jgi:large subunit ribosomal protein L24
MGNKFHIKKGDTVYVITGEYKGQQGRVLDILIKQKKAIVEGINMVAKHTKPNSQYPQGGIIKKEAPVHISNLLPVDPAKGGPTRIGRKENSKGRLVRYAKKSGEELK